MTKQFTIAFITAIGFGFVLLNPWILAYYIAFLAIVTLLGLVIIVHSLFRRTKNWKVTMLCLAVGYTAAFVAFGMDSYLSFQLVKKRNYVIDSLYKYKQHVGHFPQTMVEASNEMTSLRAHYIVDSSLANFTLYAKDLHGMPWVFSSKVSRWGR
jgi:hypothetical protein